MKFKLLKIFVFILLSFILYNNVFAYDFVNNSNKESVYMDRDDIYSLKQTYIDLVGDQDEEEEELVYEEVNNDLYWWPIGSVDTSTSGNKLFAIGDPESTIITSYFGYRGAVIDGSGRQIAGNENHGALDIANSRGVGVTNVIAAKSGVVVYPTEKDNIGCVQGSNSCNGGYGNYVIIQHSDGNYTLYAHLHTNTITVKAGDIVEQGQVIAKIGSTGNSTGPHLHFEVRLGENSSAARVDPLVFVNPDKPRSSSSSFDEIKKFVEQWEGVGCGDDYQTETEYIACFGYDNVITIGHGVVWEYNKDLFKKYGITSMSHGTAVSKDIVNKVEDEILNNNLDSIKSSLAKYGIDGLKDYQIGALLSRSYQGIAWVVSNDNYPNFVDAYLKHNGKYKFEDAYSSESSIWTDAMKRPNYTNYPGDSWGLYRRRLSEWKLFTTGQYDYFPLSELDPYKYSW